jgi:hypothetical protein
MATLRRRIAFVVAFLVLLARKKWLGFAMALEVEVEEEVVGHLGSELAAQISVANFVLVVNINRSHFSRTRTNVPSLKVIGGIGSKYEKRLGSSKTPVDAGPSTCSIPSMWLKAALKECLFVPDIVPDIDLAIPVGFGWIYDVQGVSRPCRFIERGAPDKPRRTLGDGEPNILTF